MPKAKNKRKDGARHPFRGNKVLLASLEAREIRAGLGIMAYQIQQLTGLLGGLHERLVALEPPPPEEIAPPEAGAQLELPLVPAEDPAT